MKINAKSMFALLFSLVTVASAAAAEPGKEQQPFSFVQMCDTQLGMGGYEHDVLTFKQAVKQINELQTDFVVICGDLVNKADDKSFADFNEIKATFTLPCYCAPGNHDVGNAPTKASLANYREKIGKDYYSFEHKGCTIVVANSQLWKHPVEGEAEQHDAWFKKTLEEAKAKSSPVFVVVHYPLFLKDIEEKETYSNLSPEKRKAVFALCQENGVVAFLAGHTHQQISNEKDGILLVNGETTSKNFDKRPMGFRLWNVGGEEGLRHQFVKFEGFDAEP
ncbi:MAG: metallophosphoesterase [Verrucomicrobia bacterium]|nr:metallophosphoesterase [Verrucomicrobiota bacterium]MDA1005193.1 metallophosphoesterase [Verrucomicrobiota bacterium]